MLHLSVSGGATACLQGKQYTKPSYQIDSEQPNTRYPSPLLLFNACKASLDPSKKKEIAMLVETPADPCKKYRNNDCAMKAVCGIELPVDIGVQPW